jgi:hypothetical protein
MTPEEAQAFIERMEALLTNPKDLIFIRGLV